MITQRRFGLARRIIGVMLILGSVLVALPLLSAATASPKAAPALAPQSGPPVPNRISIENALPGTDDWGDLGNYDINNLAAYNNLVSVNAGSPINVHVMSTKTQLQARLYRMGYYQNHGGRLYRHLHRHHHHRRSPPVPVYQSTGLVRCPWAATFTITTDPSWISGIYLRATG